jgi:hypothetical protein
LAAFPPIESFFMRVVVLQAVGPITQVDLENVMQLDAEIARQKAIRDRIAAGILARLASGSEVEPGPRTYDVVETYSGSSRSQKLIIR